MDGQEPYEIAYLAARTIRFVLALGVPAGIALEALETAAQLLRDTESDVPAPHRVEGSGRLH